MCHLFPEFHYGNACAAKLNMLIVGRGNARYGGEVLADDLSQGSCTCAVKDADTRGIDQQGIVYEIGDGLQGFVGSHPANIYLWMEFEMLLPYAVCRLLAYHYGLACFAIHPSFGGEGRGFQSLNVNQRPHHAKGNSRLLAFNSSNGAYGSLTFDADAIAN